MSVIPDLVSAKLIDTRELASFEEKLRTGEVSRSKATFLQDLLSYINAPRVTRRSVEDAVQQWKAERARELFKGATLRRAIRTAYLGESILIVGAGFSYPPSPLEHRLTSQQLAEHLRDDCRIAPVSTATLPLPVVATAWKRQHEHEGISLAEYVRDIVSEYLPRKPFHQHRLLAKLNMFRFIITTNWDRLIEDAFLAERGSESLHVIRNDQQLLGRSMRFPALLKIHGDFNASVGDWEDGGTPRISSGEIRRLRTEQPALYSLLSYLFSSYQIISVGYHPNDPNFQDLLIQASAASHAQARRQLDAAQPTRQRLVIVDPDSTTSAFVEHGDNPQLLEQGACQFLSHCQAYISSIACTTGHSSCSFTGHEFERTAVALKPVRERGRLADRLSGLVTRLRSIDIVASGATDITESARDSVGLRAAQVLLKQIECGHQHFCIGPGRSPARMIDYLLRMMTKQHSHVVFSPAQVSIDPSWVNGSGLANVSKLLSMPDHVRPRVVPTIVGDIVDNRGFGDLIGLTGWSKSTQQRCSSWRDYGCRSLRVEELPNCTSYFITVSDLSTTTSAFYEHAMATLRAITQPSTRSVSERLTTYMRGLKGKGYEGEMFFCPFKADPSAVTMTPEDVWNCLKENDKRGTGTKKPMPGFKKFVSQLYLSSVCASGRALYESSQKDCSEVVIIAAEESSARPLTNLLRRGIGTSLVIDEELAKECVELLEK